MNGVAPDAAESTSNATTSAYREAVLADRPVAYWRMGIRTGSIVPDDDGTQTETKPATKPLRKRTSPFTVGRAPNSNGYFWPGAIDEVAVYPEALTLAQIATHHVLGKK